MAHQNQAWFKQQVKKYTDITQMSLHLECITLNPTQTEFFEKLQSLGISGTTKYQKDPNMKHWLKPI